MFYVTMSSGKEWLFFTYPYIFVISKTFRIRTQQCKRFAAPEIVYHCRKGGECNPPPFSSNPSGLTRFQALAGAQLYLKKYFVKVSYFFLLPLQFKCTVL